MNESNKAVAKHKEYPHIEWVDLNNDGTAFEIVVVKRDKNNNDLYFIKTEDLDDIDKRRLISVLRKRDAAKYELWDLLDNVTLANGENALNFFHQLVRVRTDSGKILIPGSGRAGIALRPEPDAIPVQQEAKRGPGRPPKG